MVRDVSKLTPDFGFAIFFVFTPPYLLLRNRTYVLARKKVPFHGNAHKAFI